MKLGPSGAGELTAKERHIGDAAFELRMNLRESDARSQWVEQYVAGGLVSSIELTGDIDFQGDLPGGAATLGYQARSDGLARREVNERRAHRRDAELTSSAPMFKRPCRCAAASVARNRPSVTPGAASNYTSRTAGPAGRNLAEFAAPNTFKRQAARGRGAQVISMSTIPVDTTAPARLAAGGDRPCTDGAIGTTTPPPEGSLFWIAAPHRVAAAGGPQQAPGKALPGVPPGAATGQPRPPPSGAPPSPPAAGSGSPVR